MRGRRQIDVSNYSGYFDVSYSELSKSCTMDIFMPEGKGPFPVIVTIHGGAFKKCDKRDEEMILDMLHGLDKGYAIIGVNYRLSGEAQFPKPIQDIKMAICFIKDKAKQYNLDKNRMVVWGGSAGGYMSLMAGLIDQVKAFGDSTTSAKVQGVISWFPPVNFIKMDAYLKESGLLVSEIDHDDRVSPESLFIGASIQDNKDIVREANPETYIHKDMCKMFVQHGRMDKIVPYQGSRHFANLANEICGEQRVIYEIIEGADHGDPKFSTPENLKKVYSFIEECFT